MGSMRVYDRAGSSRALWEAVFWTTISLFFLDAAIGFAFRAPANALQVPSSMQAYFEYGRSIEGKLRREVGPTPEQDALIVRAGWIPNDCDIPTSTPDGKLGFDIYGMSFSNQIALELERLDPKLSSQRFAGPAAPPSHSYACFIRRVETNQSRAPIQILGILASSIPRMETITGLTTSFENPQPFTYPRYFVAADNGHLVAYTPSIMSQHDLRAALAVPERWQGFLNELVTHDAFYDRPIFRADVFDRSVLARMLRRAWGQHFIRSRTASLRASDNFSGVPDIAPVLRAMLLDFVDKVRATGGRPIVVLIEDQGYGRALSALAAPVLSANHIEFVATSLIVSPDDPGNFLRDGHFVPKANEKIARAVLDVLGRGAR
jgi:hypothetical protein